MSHRNKGRFSCHLRKAKERLETEPLAFGESLSAEIVLRALERCNTVFRESIYTPWLTLWAFMAQLLSGDRSCSNAVKLVIAHLVGRGQRPCSPSTGQYCDARSRLPEEVLREVFCEQNEHALKDAPEAWKWLGHEVHVVDGTTISMPDTLENRAAFPPDGEKVAGTRYPLLRAVVVFSLRLGTLVDYALAAYQGKGTGESSLFRTLFHLFQPNDVVLGDKYYCCYRDVAQLAMQQVHTVVKLHRRANLKCVKRFNKQDGLYKWIRPRYQHQKVTAEEFAQIPAEILVRVVMVRVNIPGWRVKTFQVLTTLLDPEKYSKQAVADLFRRRWRGEMFLDDIKTTLGMDMLSCRTPEMIRKELLVYCLVYNTIRIHMARAAECLGVPLDQISFSDAMRTLRAFNTPLALDTASLAVMLATIVYQRVGRRPGRSEPRAVKRGRKAYDYLKTPRKSFQQSS